MLSIMTFCIKIKIMLNKAKEKKEKLGYNVDFHSGDI